MVPRLHAAIEKKNLREVKRCINAGDDLDETDGGSEGATPLMWAVEHDDLDILNLLLKAGADTSVKCKQGLTVLGCAADDGNFGMVKALLEAGADINEGNGDTKQTALMMALRESNLSVANLLIRRKCNVLQRTLSGGSALLVAIVRGHIEIVIQLLDAGASVNEISGEGENATPVIVSASRCGQYDIIVLLLSRGAEVDLVGGDDATALYCASARGHEDIVDILLRSGADVNRQKGCSAPLHISSKLGHHKCVRLLLCAKANVSVTDSKNCTPLCLVVTNPSEGQLEVMELLLAAGADANAVDDFDNTPLSTAVMLGASKAVALLLEAGANPNRLDKNTRSILFLCEGIKAVKVMLKSGADATVEDVYGQNLLHNAASLGLSAAVIRALVKAGADPTVRTIRGETPADMARREGHNDIALLLDTLADKHSVASDIDVTADKVNSLSLDSNEHKEHTDDVTHECLVCDAAAALVCGGCGKLHFCSGRCAKLYFHLKGEKDASKGEKIEDCTDEHTAAGDMHACFNCDKMTTRTCGGCGDTYFCSMCCEMAARHVCCG